MATFLTLINLMLARLNEVPLNQSTFSTASGPQLTAQIAVNAAVSDINRRFQQWPFNYSQQTFTTTASTPSAIANEYTVPSTVTNIKWNTFQILRNDSATPPQVSSTLTELDYNLWATRVRPQDLQMSTFTTPRNVVKGDDGKIILSPPPDVAYQVAYDAWADSAPMVNYNDTCAIPDKYNYIITDGAMYYGYDFRADTAAQQLTKSKFDTGVAEMLRELVKPTDGFKSTMVVNQRTFNSIPSRYGL